jgi:hypothetical protein
VTYWEIGDETDIGEQGGCPYVIPKAGDSAAYYRMTSAPMLATFPQAKVGGPAVADRDGDLLTGFVDLCAKDGTRLDFISWQLHADEPRQHARLADKYRTLFGAKFPARRPELLVAEWNKGFDRISVEEQAYAGFGRSRPSSCGRRYGRSPRAAGSTRLGWSFARARTWSTGGRNSTPTPTGSGPIGSWSGSSGRTSGSRSGAATASAWRCRSRSTR